MKKKTTGSKQIKVKTWLPCFDGFYETIFDIDRNGDMLSNDIHEYLNYDIKDDFPALFNDKEVEKAVYDNIYNTKEFSLADEEMRKEVINQSVDVIEILLEDNQMIQSIKFQKLSSPKEYNYYNDSIIVEMIFSLENIENIKKFINANKKEWEQYIKDNYTSYSGFSSNYSNDSNDKEWQIERAIKNFHQAGAILQFICYKIDENIQEQMIEGIGFFISIKAVIEELIEEGDIIMTYFSVADENDNVLYDNGDRYCDEYERKYCLKLDSEKEALSYITDFKNQRVVKVDESGNIVE